MFEGITRKGVCVHINCEKNRHAKGLCRSHYEKLHYPKWNQARKLRELPLRRFEEEPIDIDDYWQWVKQELGIR